MSTVIDPNIADLNALKRIEEQLANKANGIPPTSQQPIQAPQNYQPQFTPPVSNIPQENQRQLYRNIKTYVVPLPSKGLIYPEGNPWKNVASVEMRKIVSQDSDILTSKKLLGEGTALSILLKKLILDPNLDPFHLYNGDHFALIIAARMKALTNTYNPNLRYICDYCDSEFENNFDLSILSTIDETNKYSHVNNVFSLALPESKAAVQVKLLTIQEEKEMLKVIDATNKQYAIEGIDKSDTIRLQHYLLSYNGETDRANINQFCEWMDYMDKEYILQFINEIEPKVDFTQELQCTVCSGKTKSKRVIPFTESFFRPKISFF